MCRKAHASVLAYDYTPSVYTRIGEDSSVNFPYPCHILCNKGMRFEMKKMLKCTVIYIAKLNTNLLIY